jgi:hypothetical protein
MKKVVTGVMISSDNSHAGGALDEYIKLIQN